MYYLWKLIVMYCYFITIYISLCMQVFLKDDLTIINTGSMILYATCLWCIVYSFLITKNNSANKNTIVLYLRVIIFVFLL